MTMCACGGAVSPRPILRNGTCDRLCFKCGHGSRSASMEIVAALMMAAQARPLVRGNIRTRTEAVRAFFASADIV